MARIRISKQMTYAELELRIRQWALNEPRIEAIVVYGSRATPNQESDEWSDLDLILFVSDLAYFVAQTDWLTGIAKTWLRVLAKTGHGRPEWLVLFEGGLKADFILVEAADSVATALAETSLRGAVQGGARILAAKQEQDRQIAPTVPVERMGVSSAEFAVETQRFWLGVYRIAVLLRRGDLWRARMTLDGPLRQNLQTMIAWHAHAGGSDHESWRDDRFIEAWAGEEIAAALPAFFGHYTVEASGRVLGAMVDLYARLGTETAQKWEYPEPNHTANAVQAWLRVLLNLV